MEKPKVETPKVTETQAPAKPQAAPVPVPKPVRLPVPPEEERQTVSRQLRELFDLAKDRKPAESRALAGELLDLAEKSKSPAERYVLFETAAGLACQGGDVAGMFRTIDKLAAAFEVDALAEKRALVATLAKSANSSAGIAALLAAGDKVIDDALARGQYELALELAEEAYKACAQSAGRDHRKRAYDRRKRVQALAASWKELQAVLEKLKTDPDDPAANLAAGRHYCFERGDWAKGLSHLSKSSDATLKQLAQQELQSPPSDAAAMIKLADAWWALSESRENPDRAALMLRAGTWYREAQPEVTSTLLKAKLDTRLKAIAKLGRPIPEPTLLGPPPPAIAPFDAAGAKRHQQRWAKHLGVPVETTNSIGMKLVLIPPGEFEMGSTKEEIDKILKAETKEPRPEWLVRGVRSEVPRHHVRITKPWYFAACEVTVGQFRKFVDETGYKTDNEKKGETTSWRNAYAEQTDGHPVVCVSCNDAVAFCQWLGRKEGKEYRLPTEAQWEHACRAGTTTRFSFGNDETLLGQYAWWAGNCGGTTHPVGQKRPNPWGLQDVHGNAYELCIDCFAPDYYAQSPPDDPDGAATGWGRPLRGGARWEGDPACFWCAFRFGTNADVGKAVWGCRVAMAVTTAESRPAAPAGREPPPAVAPFDEKQARQFQADWARHLQMPVETANSIGMKLVLIPPGEFEMGTSEEEVDQILKVDRPQPLGKWIVEGLHSEVPQHHVRITKPFCLAACEATVGQFRRFVDDTGYKTDSEKRGEATTWRNAFANQTDDHPVVQVSWNDAVAFCQWLSRKEGKEYTLPSDAQWEYACRAGTTTRFSFGDDAALLGQYAWGAGNCGRSTQPVRQKRPNPWGLYDMHGNTWEIVYDRFSPDYFRQSPEDDPQGPATGDGRVVRGGGWWEGGAMYFGSARRMAVGAAGAKPVRGFRVVMAVTPAKSRPAASAGRAPAPAIAPFDEKQAKQFQADWARHLGTPVETTNSIGMKLALIPPGEFEMGGTDEEVAGLLEEANKSLPEDWYLDLISSQAPRHRVRITKPFYTGVYEVTQSEYAAVMPEGRGGEADAQQKGRYPVGMISWDDAVEFCRRLSALPEEKAAVRLYRLPTEAEWEYACRAGTTPRYFFGDDDAALDAFAWYGENAKEVKHPVGQKKPNPWGLYDMPGGAWEWCADWFDHKYYRNSPRDDPPGAASAGARAIRGGTRIGRRPFLRSAFRSSRAPAKRADDNGFRVVCNTSAAGRLPTGDFGSLGYRVRGTQR